jgi:hypothetical protein
MTMSKTLQVTLTTSMLIKIEIHFIKISFLKKFYVTKIMLYFTYGLFNIVKQSAFCVKTLSK